MSTLATLSTNSEQSAHTPASQEDIDSLLTWDGDGEKCAIWTEAKNEEVLLLNCGHTYHSECITTWLRITSTCP